MIYNRYIPGADGRYEHHRVVPCPAAEPEQSKELCAQAPTGLPRLPFRLPDTGDLLVLLVLLLILTDGEETDSLTTLITLAAFLLLR